MLFEVLRTQTWIFGQGRPSNSMNPRLSYCCIIQKLVKANFGILFPVFSLNTTLKKQGNAAFCCKFTESMGIEQPSYVITPESLARRSKWRSREVRTRLEGLSEEAEKKNLERENIFLCEKSTFGDLKSILGDIFLKSGGSL